MDRASWPRFSRVRIWVAPTPHLSDNARPFMDTPTNPHRPAHAGQCHPRALHGRRPGREFGTSRRAHGHGRHRRGAVARRAEAQPGNPHWWNRDRFVLSNGHGSMLLYSLLHLTGYPVTIDELKNFRQLGARTAGHPERDLEMGIETTTGPLGQGFANAVGMALAEKMLAAQYNRDGHDARRSPHLLLRRRRLPDGRHLARSRFARRSPEARQAHRVLRRQRHLDRRQGRRLVHRRHAEALRSLRLARREECRRPRCGRGRRGDQEGAGPQGSAVDHLLQDHHRLGRAQQAGHQVRARRGAGPRRSRERRARRSAGSPAVRSSRRHPRRLGSSRSGHRGREEMDCACSGATSANSRPKARSSSAA